MIEIITQNETERKKLNNLSKADLQKVIIYQVKNSDNFCLMMRKDNHVEFIPLSYKGKGRFKSRSITDILYTLLESGRKIFIFDNILEVIFFTDIQKTVANYLEEHYK